MTQTPRIPRPPSKGALDQISEEQAMIADEWAPQPPPAQGTERPGAATQINFAESAQEAKPD
jgi:hypothetical protein